MSATYPTSAFVSLPAPAFASPRGLGAGLAALGPVAAALLRLRELHDALNRRWFKRPSGNGGPETPPEDHSGSDSIWDDSELWMMIMMH
ncbi:hypothetical protein [Candidatus Binatus sp.]|uniref:hypothetical protein n=1 Tax=Candidatus Binatus sp. TaxID=2811406 RepID=UPI003CC66CCF